MDDLRIYEFRPLFLTLERIGPFRNIHEIDFTDSNHHPCNFYMVVSGNGMGKTTALEIFSCLMNLLGKKEISAYGHDDLDKKDGRAQLDFWVRLHWQGRDMSVVLSIIAGRIGEETFLKPWADDQLTLHSAESWHRLGFRSPVSGRYENIMSRKDELLLDLLSAVRTSQENTTEEYFFQPTFHLPTVLYFSAYRDIPGVSDDNNGSGRTIGQPSHWNYRPLYAFDAHSTLWRDSLDNLVVWLKWLSDASFKAAQELIDEQVFVGTPKRFKDVRKVPPEAQIDAGNGETHGLNRLSSGEKSLVHLFLRIGAHGTANTIILIDEIDAHLHIRWQHRLYNALEKLAKDYPGFTVIMTTHSTEILRRFTAAMNIEKEGLYLGGDLIEQHELN